VRGVRDDRGHGFHRKIRTLNPRASVTMARSSPISTSTGTPAPFPSSGVNPASGCCFTTGDRHLGKWPAASSNGAARARPWPAGSAAGPGSVSLPWPRWCGGQAGTGRTWRLLNTYLDSPQPAIPPEPRCSPEPHSAQGVDRPRCLPSGLRHAADSGAHGPPVRWHSQRDQAIRR
jgi:hypothetical protein